METRQCKCGTAFEPEFARQKRCNGCKQDALLRKQKSRRKQNAAEIPSADDWFEDWSTSFSEQAEQVREHVKEVQRTVRQELRWPDSTFETYGWSREKYADAFPLGHTPEAEAVQQVACSLFCLKKNQRPFVREVHSPSGVKVGGLYFPDVLGSDIVHATHKFSLEKSGTYSRMYRELLQLLDQRFGRNNDEHTLAIKRELAGSGA